MRTNFKNKIRSISLDIIYELYHIVNTDCPVNSSAIFNEFLKPLVTNSQSMV